MTYVKWLVIHTLIPQSIYYCYMSGIHRLFLSILIISIFSLLYRYNANHCTSSTHTLILSQLHQSYYYYTIVLHHITVLLHSYTIVPTYVKWLVIHTLIPQSIVSHFYISQSCHCYTARCTKIISRKNNSAKVVSKPENSLQEKLKSFIYWAKFEIQLIVK